MAKHRIILNLCAIALVLLIVSPGIHLYPQRRVNDLKINKNISSTVDTEPIEHNDHRVVLMVVKTEKEASEAIKTLNSFIANATTANEMEKPVSKLIDVHDQSNESRKDTTAIAATELQPLNISIKSEFDRRQAKQYSIPLVPISMNWISNMRPMSAIVISEQQPLRIWAIGSVSKFPRLVENLVQRIQSYFSNYKYSDLSRPASLAVINAQYHQNSADEVEELIDIDTETPTYDDEATTELFYSDETENETETESENYTENDDGGFSESNEVTDSIELE